MRNIFVVTILLLLPAPIAVAGPADPAKRQEPSQSNRLLPVKGPGSERSCGAYGPGFVKIEGTETCVKIGGAIRLGVGGSVAGAGR